MNTILNSPCVSRGPSRVSTLTAIVCLSFAGSIMPVHASQATTASAVGASSVAPVARAQTAQDGLRFGRARVVSAPGQPLQVTLPIEGLSQSDAASFSVRLADAAAWNQAGLTPPAPLPSMRTEVADVEASRRMVTIRSSQPAASDSVDLLFDITTATGARQIQFSVLAPQSGLMRPAVPALPAAPARMRSAAASNAPAIDAAPRAAPRARGTVVVRNRQTLSGIAMAHPTRGADYYQMIVALWQANPDAFIEGNMNLVRAGERLTLPDDDTVRGMDAATARRTYNEHLEAHARYRARVGGAAVASAALAASGAAAGTLSTTASPSPAPSASTQDRLRLTGGDAPAQGSSVAGDRDASNALAVADANRRVATLTRNVDDLNRVAQASGAAGGSNSAGGSVAGGGTASGGSAAGPAATPNSATGTGTRAGVPGIAATGTPSAGTGTSSTAATGTAGPGTGAPGSSVAGASSSGTGAFGAAATGASAADTSPNGAGGSTPGAPTTGTSAAGVSGSEAPGSAPAGTSAGTSTSAAVGGTQAGSSDATSAALADAARRGAAVVGSTATPSADAARTDATRTDATRADAARADPARTDATSTDPARTDASSTDASRAAGSRAEADTDDAGPLSMSGLPSWLTDNLLIVVTGILALIAFLIAWAVRRAAARREEDDNDLDADDDAPLDKQIDPVLIDRQLDRIDLDLDSPTTDRSHPGDGPSARDRRT